MTNLPELPVEVWEHVIDLLVIGYTPEIGQAYETNLNLRRDLSCSRLPSMEGSRSDVPSRISTNIRPQPLSIRSPPPQMSCTMQLRTGTQILQQIRT